MKKLLVWISVLAFLFIGVGSASASSILLNGNADSGTDYWTVNNYSIQSTGGQGGDNGPYFNGGFNNGDGWLIQTGATCLTAGNAFKLSGYYMTASPDYGTASITFYNSANEILNSYSHIESPS